MVMLIVVFAISMQNTLSSIPIPMIIKSVSYENNFFAGFIR